MVIEYDHRDIVPINPHKAFESGTGPEYSFFIDILENRLAPETDIIEGSLDDRKDTYSIVHSFESIIVRSIFSQSPQSSYPQPLPLRVRLCR